MGKGDKRSRKGKIVTGSFGKTRPKKKKAHSAEVVADAKAKKKKEASG
ncbi:MAG: 30S ribosomal protein THX [Pyrinomonadaceae bacterium]